MSDEGRVTLARDGHIATVLFDRPQSRNAMTSAMYAMLHDHCIALSSDRDIRSVIFRGAGGEAFVAGSDIAEFVSFRGGDDGIAYEARMDAILDAIAAIPVPTIAAIDALAVGGGLNIAAACDIRIATKGARFGAPIARTLGNCLSMRNYSVLLAMLGPSLARRMLFLGELVSETELTGSGFLTRVVEAEELGPAATELAERIAGSAPLTLAASKMALQRLEARAFPNGGDLIRQCYGSRDFREGVSAFVEKRKPVWAGT